MLPASQNSASRRWQAIGRRARPGRSRPAPRSGAYERTSAAITTTPRFSKWATVLSYAKMTTASLDRHTHHCHILETGNESCRFKISSAKLPKPTKEKPRNLTAAWPEGHHQPGSLRSGNRRSLVAGISRINLLRLKACVLSRLRWHGRHRVLRRTGFPREGCFLRESPGRTPRSASLVASGLGYSGRA